MNLSNTQWIPMTVDGKKFAVTWQDFGSYFKMNVFQNGKQFGSKKFPILVDTGDGVMAYAIKSMMRAKQDGKATDL